MNLLKKVVGALVLLIIAYSAYWLGTESSSTSVIQPISSNPQNLHEVLKLEFEFEQQQQDIRNRVVDVQNQIETVKLNMALRESKNAIQSTENLQNLQLLDDRLLAMQSEGISDSVPIPPDSPSGRIISQPRSESGIPISVLQKYQQDTGVSPSEIEDLMRRN